MAQGQSIKMKDPKENMREGMLRFCCDITVEKVTNTQLSKRNSDLTSRIPVAVISSTYFSYQKVQTVNEFYS